MLHLLQRECISLDDISANIKDVKKCEDTVHSLIESDVRKYGVSKEQLNDENGNMCYMYIRSDTDVSREQVMLCERRHFY